MAKVKGPKVQGSNGVKFVFDGARPHGGTELASYTVAWLALSGMDDGRAIPAEQVKKIAGKRAFSYHTGNGNWERTDSGVVLTEQGFMHFGNIANGSGINRNIRPDPEMVKAYTETMQSGKVSAMVKNPAMIKPL